MEAKPSKLYDDEFEPGPPPDVDEMLFERQNGQAAKGRVNNDAKPSKPKEHKPGNGAVLLGPENRTDAGTAKRFVDRYHDELLYVAPWKKWLAWDGRRWAVDHSVGVHQRAKEFSNSLWADFVAVAKYVSGDGSREILNSLRSYVQKTNSTSGIENYLSLAQYDPRVVCQVDALNKDPYLLNVLNGTIDLRTGELRPHSPGDRLTQLAPVAYDPAAGCPKWLKTLELIFDGNAELIRYVQQLLGYSISGDTGEHLLPIAFGSGNNGKSTLWGTVTELLGNYATLASEELLLGSKSNHPTEKASLYQMRFVAISEPEKNSSLRESRVKELTGDRTINARRMHEDFWTFQRTHTFWLSTNHLPKIDGTDLGIWRRVKLIPFNADLSKKTTVIKDFDRWLLANEGPGILSWLVRGYLDYRANGLIEPKAVVDATATYRGDSDELGDFIAEYCVLDENAMVPASELFRVYRDMHKGTDKQTTFGKDVANRYQRLRPDKGPFRKKTVYKGLRFRDELDDEPESEKDDVPRENKDCPPSPIVKKSVPGKLPSSRGEQNNGGHTWASGDSQVDEGVDF